jgi:hypothetical protein
MKRIVSIAALFAIAVGFVSCNKEEINSVPEEGYTYSFAILDDATRATMDNLGVAWESGDQVGMYLQGYTGYAKVDMSTTPKSVILYSRNEIPANSYAYAYYPYNSDNTDKTATKVVINNVQDGGSNAAMPMAGIPFKVETSIPVDDDTKKAEGNGTIKFLNLGSIIDFKIFSTNYTGETVQYVTFKADNGTVSGDGIIDLTAIDANNASTLELAFTGNNNYDNVKVNQEVAVADSKDAAESIYMVVAPGTYSGTITIGTDVATYTFNFSNKTLNRNGLKHYNMNLDNATRVAEVVEVVKDLPYPVAFTTGKGEFVIEGDTGNEWTFGQYGATVSGYYQAEGESGKTNHTANTSLVSPWINLEGVTNAQMTFHQGRNKFLNDDDIVLSIQKYGESTWTSLDLGLPNKPNSGFAQNDPVISLSDYVGNKVKVKFTYTSTDTNAGTYEFKDFLVAKVKAAAGLSFNTTEFEVEVGDDFTAPDLVNPNELTVAYSSDNEEVAMVNATTGVVTLQGGTGIAIISAAFAGNDDYEAETVSYSITVTDPEAIPDDETIVFGDLNLTNATKYTDPFNGGHFTVSFGDGENDGTYYTTGNGIRTYANGKINISSSYEIVRVDFTFANNYAPTAGNFTVNSGDLVPGASSVWTGKSKSIVLTDTGTTQWRLQSVKVYYSEPEIPVYNITLTSPTNGSLTSNYAKAEEGTEITLTVSPDEGYKLGTLTVNGDNVTSSVTNGHYVFSMPGEDVSVEASFVLIPQGEKTYTITWNATNNSEAIGGYSNDWVVTADGLTCSMQNWNNNNNGWNYVKAGSKNAASVATIISPAIPEAIKTVTITIDALTASSINSIKLYVSSSADFSNASSYDITKSKGDQSVSIVTPTTNCYYKIVADCAKGSSNGLIQVSKLVFTTN